MPKTNLNRGLRRSVRWVLSRRPVRVRSGPAAGMRMDLRRASAWYARGDNEPAVQAAVRDNLAPGGVFIDVGANVGFFSLIAARTVGPAGRVFSLDPVPANAAAIRRNASLNSLDNLTVIEAAVCAEDAQSELTVTRHPGGAVLAGLAAPPDPVERIKVRTVSIDGLVRSGETPPPTLVKIDVEGAELDVLRGMESTARTHRPRVICELDDADPAALDSKIAGVTDTLRGWGYAVRRLEKAYGDSGVVHLVATTA